jgi:dTDP-4-dehydrorhamnose 3,5-epimerase
LIDVIHTHFAHEGDPRAVLELSTNRIGDDRGAFSVTYEASLASRFGITELFVQDNQSISTRRGTLRGIHLQLPPFEQGKLVRVLRGRILDVIVDARPDSPTLGHSVAIEVSAEARNQVWIPRGFGHAFCTLDDDTEVFYKVDAPWAPEAERSILWSDPALGIDWTVDTGAMTLSDKDADAPSFAEILAEIEAALNAVEPADEHQHDEQERS